MSQMFKSPRSFGLTLIELLITAALVSILLVAVWAVYRIGFTVFNSELSRTTIIQETSQAMMTMSSELRQLTSVTSAQQSSVIFSEDVNGDGINETVQYVWSGTAGAPLNRVLGASTSVLMRSVNSLSFSYYNSSNVLLPLPVTPAQVSGMVIDVTAAKADEGFRLGTKVDIRAI